jgi:hypothetical protein
MHSKGNKMEYGQQKQAEQRAFRRAENMADKMVDSMTANYGAVIGQSTASLKSSPIDADLDGMERELNVLIDSLAILRQRLNPVLCSGFEFVETPGEPMRDSSPISYRLNVFRSCVREATNRIDALRSGLEI